MTGELTITNPMEPAPIDIPGDDVALGDVFDRMVTNNGADRGDGGKFVSPAGTEGATAGDPPLKSGEGAVDQPSPVTAAPAHLPQAIKADWDKMSESARSELAKLTADWDRKFGEVGKYKPISDKIVSAAQQFPEFRGLTPDQIADGAIRLAAVQTALEKGPESAVSTILEVAKSYNVLQQLAQVFGGQANDNQTVVGLQQKIANLEAQVAKAGSPDFIREQITSTMTERETEAFVRTFIASDGVKEFWPDVEAHIPNFIRLVKDEPANSGKSPQEILETAYDMAINALPDVRVKVRAAEAKATVPVSDPKRTEAAKRAASINAPSNGSGKERLPTEDELLAAAFDRKMAS